MSKADGLPMNDRYPNFDLLRLLLAVEAVVAHGWYLSSEQYSWYGFIMAVPAFFGISGFLVLKSCEESGAWAAFMRKRAMRVFPPLLVAMALCWVLFDGVAVYGSFLYWITGGLFMPGGMINPPAGTLAWAMVAYFCLSVLWMMGAYKQPLVIWILFGISLFILQKSNHLDPQTQLRLFYIPSFLIGNLAYLHRKLLLKVNPVVPWVFLVAVIFSHKIPYFVLLVNLSQVSFQTFAIVWVGMAGFRLLPARLPDISYGLYIYHWPIAVYLDELKLTPTPADMALWLPIPLLAMSLVSWYFVENPARHPVPTGGTRLGIDRYPNFDLLRVLLALEVVIAHAWALIDPTVDGGIIMAVPAFLAISGFLVLKSYEESGTWSVFIRKRALRILPALAISMALCWVLFDWTAVYHAFLNWITGGILTQEGVTNAPLWSLAWEELAYLALALLWMAGAYKRPFVIWALLAVSLVIVHQGRHLNPNTQIILFLMPAFFIGNLAYLHREWLLKVDPSIPWLLLMAVIFSANIPYVAPVVNHNGVTMVSFQAFAVVWVGMAGFQAVSFRFPDISYGLYIYHWPIIIYLLDNQIVGSGIQMAQWLPVPLLGICLFSWYLVEKPALRLKPRAPTKFSLAAQ